MEASKKKKIHVTAETLPKRETKGEEYVRETNGKNSRISHYNRDNVRGFWVNVLIKYFERKERFTREY